MAFGLFIIVETLAIDNGALFVKYGTTFSYFVLFMVSSLENISFARYF